MHLVRTLLRTNPPRLLVGFQKENMADDVQVKVCQQEIIKLDLELKALIQDIRECADSIDVLQDLNFQVQEKVLDLKEHIQDLERLGKEQDKETDTISILKDVEKQNKQLSRNQLELRRANLSSQMAIEKRTKEKLLEGASALQKGRSNKEDVARTAKDITQSLMSISRRMAAQVQRGEDTVGTLATSSQRVGETHEEFKVMRGHIQHSRKLLTRYGRRECTDKMLILLAMVFFFATVLYIVKKRLFSASEVLTTNS